MIHHTYIPELYTIQANTILYFKITLPEAAVVLPEAL